MVGFDDDEVISFVHRAQEGDEEAWLSLVLRYGDSLRKLAERRLDVRLRSRIDTDDVVQDSLLDAFNSLHGYPASAMPLGVWLRRRLLDRIYRIHRDYLDVQARDLRREAAAGPPWHAGPKDPGTSPSGKAIRGEASAILRDMLGQLSESERQILVLFYFERLDHCVISKKLEISESSSRQRLHRATDRFGKILKRNYPEWCHAFQSPGS